MNISELSFESFESETSDLEIINEFFDHNEEPTPMGRIYKGAKYRDEFEFGLRELPLDEITHQDENYLVGYEPDCSKYIMNGMLVYKPSVKMGLRGNYTTKTSTIDDRYALNKS